jgi:membrane-associated protease RseP (regulator of RpoE activity)
VRLTLLARGSSIPDVLEIKLSEPGSILRTIEALNVDMPLYGAWSGLLAVDVLDAPVKGPVVAQVLAGTPAALAGLEPGDVILKANGQATPDAVALTTAMNAALATQKIALELRGRNGATKRTDVNLVRIPRAITPNDQTILFNTLLVGLRHRLTTAGRDDEGVLRLNIGIALIALENWQDALAAFEGIRLGTGGGVADGTLQYYRGICYNRLGKFAEATQAWTAAKNTDAWLTEDGPPIKALAEARLAASLSGGK